MSDQPRRATTSRARAAVGARASRAGAGRRPGPLAVLTIVVPVLTVLALLGVGVPKPPAAQYQDPTTAPLTRVALVCPAVAADGQVLVASTATGDGGKVLSRSGGRAAAASSSRLDVSPDRTTALTGDDAGAATRLVGVGAKAPGLSATRAGGPGLQVTACPTTSADQWFTGVGAGAEHSSVLELTNPDAGPATASVSLVAQSGPVSEGLLDGISVPGRTTLRIDLASRIPKREELALHVVAARGRIAASLVDSFRTIGGGRTSDTSDYLSGQSTPADSSVMLGVPEDPRGAAVLVANPGDSSLQVQVNVVTAQSTFQPRSLDPVVVPPHTLRRVAVGALLRSKPARGALGLQVEASAPVVASFRARVGNDLMHLTPSGALDGPAAVPVPVTRSARLVLGGAEALGRVRVTARDTRGRTLAEETLQIAPDRGVDLDLPEGTALVQLDPSGSPVQGSVLVSGPSGVGAVAIQPPLTERLVPAVRPGLPPAPAD
ncbi:DUF5719 family protein [Nocardioides acrostichi]|uniref:Secreted protein n=1 Tax=Nocardioides acrostichi TaxID=2784339 RepID=A0A930Y7C6_9ACTN|nr:DUF5719 family protein [Nocardioides acrostichi]MBF4161856.1 hypothetical protein [Nocardioides acrostichi]